MSGSLPPCRVAGEFLEQVFPCGGKFVSDEAQTEEPAPEGVFRIIGDRARRAGRFGAQRLCADGEAQLDIRLYLACVECAVEGAEFDGVLAEADVDVDAAGAVGLCARRPDGSDDLLHHLDVLVAAHRADHLRRGAVTEPSRSTVQCRPSGMGTFQSSRWRPTYRAVVPFPRPPRKPPA